MLLGRGGGERACLAGLVRSCLVLQGLMYDVLHAVHSIPALASKQVGDGTALGVAVWDAFEARWVSFLIMMMCAQ